jgi:hypothetical protein
MPVTGVDTLDVVQQAEAIGHAANSIEVGVGIF